MKILQPGGATQPQNFSLFKSKSKKNKKYHSHSDSGFGYKAINNKIKQLQNYTIHVHI